MSEGSSSIDVGHGLAVWEMDEPELMEQDLESEAEPEEDGSDDESSGLDTKLESMESESKPSENSSDSSGSDSD